MRVKLGDLILVLIELLGEVERISIHKYINNLLESGKISINERLVFREGLHGVYSPRITAELMKLTALGFLNITVRRSLKGYIYFFSLTSDGERVVKNLKEISEYLETLFNYERDVYRFLRGDDL